MSNSNNCVCFRESKTVLCLKCKLFSGGRIHIQCPQHRNVTVEVVAGFPLHGDGPYARCRHFILATEARDSSRSATLQNFLVTFLFDYQHCVNCKAPKTYLKEIDVDFSTIKTAVEVTMKWTEMSEMKSY